VNKTVSSVIDDINEWERTPGNTIYYVTAFFTDGDVGSAGRKDMDAAIEVQGLLRESIGTPLEFTLDPGGQTKSGKTKWKILGFGTPGGAAKYTAPGVQGGGSGLSSPARGRSPEHDQFIQERMDRRTALMQAVELLRPVQEKHESGEVTASLGMAVADWMYEWLRQTSEPASSAYHDASVDSPRTTQAGAGSETTSPAAGPAEVPGETLKNAGVATNGAETPAGDDRGGQSEGEAGCPPHQLNLDVQPKAMRYPCRKCGSWVKPTMAADEVAAE